MKKIIFIILAVTTVSVMNDLTKENIKIPKEAIRFRVIANSDSNSDQQIKKNVAKNLEKTVFNSLSNTNSLNDTRKDIENNLDLYKEVIDNTLKENDCNMNYEINYGKNYFPSKSYRGLTYKEGEYESLVVTIGKGEGQNFWCVLFPPLCLIDEDKTDSEYHFLVKDLINKYLKNN